MNDTCRHRPVPGVRCHLLAGHWSRHRRRWGSEHVHLDLTWSKEARRLTSKDFGDAAWAALTLVVFVFMGYLVLAK